MFGAAAHHRKKTQKNLDAHLSPKGAPPPVKWPKIIGKSVVYSLTGWNPMGKDAPHEQNLAANQRLQQDLAEWKGMNTRPRAWWHSFGFNEKEGWREDGFSVAFAPEERRFAKQCMQKLPARTLLHIR